MKRILPLVLGLGMSAFFATSAAARPAECLFELEDSTFIDGQCDFEQFGNDGSFRLTDYNNGIQVEVRVTNPGQAASAWTGPYGAKTLEWDFGGLRRDGACWMNSMGRVCAW